MFSVTLAGVLLLLAVLAGVGQFVPWRSSGAVFPRDLGVGKNPARLYVLVHGLNAIESQWQEIAKILAEHGSVLMLQYDANPLSNADPYQIAASIDEQVDQNSSGATEIVFIAHSMGALLSRRAVLDARIQGREWAAKKLTRMVLLAGMNRGWSVEGSTSTDASWFLEPWFKSLYWFAKLIGQGELLAAMERGSPFVSDLRLMWMQYIRQEQMQPLQVVQLLGDIDDVVSRADNEDLQTTSVGKFALLRVRGTGHRDILDIGKDSQACTELQRYRREKLILAATHPFKEVEKQNEELPVPTNPRVTDLIFVVHGIRDLGRWSSVFEQEVKRQHPEKIATLRFESPRYGYLGMGPFLFESVRDRYVRWFMDEYTQAIARHPNVDPKNIRLFAHSNGSYVVANALETYKSMTVGNVVFAGSVVPTSFEWGKLENRIGAVRNYVGSHDWVVALFPNLFELPLIRSLNNPLGGGGFLGFKASNRVENVLIPGAHGAFNDHETEIVTFLMDGHTTPLVSRDEASLSRERNCFQRALGNPLIILLTWSMLAAMLLFTGIRVVGASASPMWPTLLLYVLLVITVLRTI